jgi:transposase-like protein
MPYQSMSLSDFASRYATQAACVTAIIERRWPQGWTCRKCGGNRGCRLHSRRVIQCLDRECRAQSSVTRGTVFEQMKIPLPKIFLAIYLMTDKQGISAMALSKHLDVAYNTAFDLLHKLRLAMADRDRHYTLDGVLQVDEAYVGGHGDGRHRRGRATDTKSLIGVAVEQRASNVTGHIHIEVLPAADAEALHGMILEKVKSSARLLTDDWCGYRGIGRKGYEHDPIRSPGGQHACSQWPLVHRAISNFKNWLLGTHRNFCQQRLPAYAAEYCWRANRRNMSKDEYAGNLREPLLPDRLLTLACLHHHQKPCEVRKARWAA